MHEKKIARAYLLELFSSLGIYMLILFVSIKIGRPMPEGLLRTVLLASPMLGFFLAIWAIARQVARMDEYIRRLLLENIAIAFAITAAVSFTYGFMETAGYPKLSMFMVWGVMGGSWGAVSVLRKVLDR
jgi:hydrogenase-4 membrane subunit HyfE